MRWLLERGWSDRSLQPGDAAAGAGGSARGRSISWAPCRAVLDHHDALRAATGCGSEAPWRPGGGAGRQRWLPATACGGLTFAVLMTRGVGPALSRQAQAAERRLSPAAGVMVAGGLVRCWRAGVPGRLLVTIHHLACGRGVVAHPGAGACGGVGGDCARRHAGRWRRGDLVSAGGRSGLVVACTADGLRRGACRSGRGCWARCRCLLGRGLRSMRFRDINGHGRASHAHACRLALTGALLTGECRRPSTAASTMCC